MFAHSYGGEVAAKALHHGTRIEALVFLSVPVNTHVGNAAATGVRVIDVRLKVDPVLTIARCQQRVRQRLPQAGNVTEVILSKWRLDHGATHKGLVWDNEKVASRGRL